MTTRREIVQLVGKLKVKTEIFSILSFSLSSPLATPSIVGIVNSFRRFLPCSPREIEENIKR